MKRWLIAAVALFTIGGLAAPAGATTTQPTGYERATVTLTKSRANAAHCVVSFSFSSGTPKNYYRLVGGDTAWASYLFITNRAGSYSYGFAAQKSALVGVQASDIDFYFLGTDSSATPADPIPVTVRLVNRCTA